MTNDALTTLLAEIEADHGLLFPATLDRLVELAPNTILGAKIETDDCKYRRTLTAAEAKQYNVILSGGYHQEMWIQEVVR